MPAWQFLTIREKERSRRCEEEREIMKTGREEFKGRKLFYNNNVFK